MALSKDKIENYLKNTGSDFVVLDINNPKNQAFSPHAKGATIFPYYAGYAGSFAKKTLISMGLSPDSLVIDPWNGSGITTQAAASLGVRAFGCDLNPVMVIAAKAALWGGEEKDKIARLASDLVKEANVFDKELLGEEPLETWFYPSSAGIIRNIESAINCKFFTPDGYDSLFDSEIINKIDPVAAILYVGLFRSVRKLLLDFVPTNPTWVKHPKSKTQRKRPSRETIERGFIIEIQALAESTSTPPYSSDGVEKISIVLGDAKDLPLGDSVADVVLTSPPYCTRIDYAVATSIELAVLRCSKERFSAIRRSLMGSSTVERKPSVSSKQWGSTCIQFLERLYNHPSQASKTYYFKTHLQYFSALNESIKEVARVLRVGGYAILVVQDSYYKEIRNDIAKITVEMAVNQNLKMIQKKDFLKNNSMSVINSRAKKYVEKRETVETVLVFKLFDKNDNLLNNLGGK